MGPSDAILTWVDLTKFGHVTAPELNSTMEVVRIVERCTYAVPNFM